MRRVSRVQVNVTDLDKARRFYGDLLGFGLQPEAGLKPGHDRLQVLQPDGPAFVLHRVERPGLPDYPNAGRTLLVLHSDDLDDDVRRLRAAGVVFLQSQPSPSSAGRTIGFLDPFGNVLELLQPPAGG